MKIITYSDLHLEFGNNFKPPRNSEANLMILAGDIVTFKNFKPLSDFLLGWNKPVLYVAGNHETTLTDRWMQENMPSKTTLPPIFQT